MITPGSRPEGRWKYTPFGASAPPFPRKRWHNKAPWNYFFICSSILSTGCSAPACGGSPAKRARGNAFPTGAAWFACFPLAPKARLSGFIIRGALPYFRAPTTAAKQPIKFAAKPPLHPFPPFWYCVPPFHPHIGRATKGKRLYFLVSP